MAQCGHVQSKDEPVESPVNTGALDLSVSSPRRSDQSPKSIASDVPSSRCNGSANEKKPPKNAIKRQLNPKMEEVSQSVPKNLPISSNSGPKVDFDKLRRVQQISRPIATASSSSSSSVASLEIGKVVS